MALAERGAPVAQAILATVGMRAGTDARLGLRYAYLHVIGAGHARETGQVQGKQQGK
jgi:hypothetical protein